jgi:colanic acid/amylovoran biosynthesis glycosyltransferase
MKIAIVVQGRFHAFDLGKALIARGHDVKLFTNYPKWAVKRFGFPEEYVRSFWLHGVIARASYRVAGVDSQPDRWLHPLFGRWVANALAREQWDVIHGWSGVSEEIHGRSTNRHGFNFVMRGSAHIRAQDAILADEERRTGIRLDRPGEWVQRREEREYALADRVVVLSTFARDTFVAQGVDPARVRVIPLGADTALFRPSADVIESRCERILSGEPLRVLYVGALSLRKGLWDARSIVQRLGPDRFHFRFVGPVTSDGKQLAREIGRVADVVPKVRHDELPAWYARSDVFFFPTLEDGYAVVLAQAEASGLPILTTGNCSGPDLVAEAETGWILPIRDPDAFVERLLWCDANRPVLAAMVRRIYAVRRTRSWGDVARDFESMCTAEMSPLTYRAVANG